MLAIAERVGSDLHIKINATEDLLTLIIQIELLSGKLPCKIIKVLGVKVVRRVQETTSGCSTDT
jgi:hypothetical protein